MQVSNVEVWRNNANGSRWYHVFDPTGREVTKIAHPRKSFTLTTFERQINQSKAADPSMDLFRNGTFTLQKAADETDVEEFSSPDALTDIEINELVCHIINNPKSVAKILAPLKSSVTCNRIYESLVVEDAPKSVVEAAKAKVDSFESVIARESTIVSTAPSPSGGARGPKMPDKPVGARK